jgi:hypothetical protein
VRFLRRPPTGSYTAEAEAGARCQQFKARPSQKKEDDMPIHPAQVGLTSDAQPNNRKK